MQGRLLRFPTLGILSRLSCPLSLGTGKMVLLYVTLGVKLNFPIQLRELLQLHSDLTVDVVLMNRSMDSGSLSMRSGLLRVRRYTLTRVTI